MQGWSSRRGNLLCGEQIQSKGIGGKQDLLENSKYPRLEGRVRIEESLKGKVEIKCAVARELEKFFICNNGQRKQ